MIDGVMAQIPSWLKEYKAKQAAGPDDVKTLGMRLLATVAVGIFDSNDPRAFDALKAFAGAMWPVILDDLKAGGESLWLVKEILARAKEGSDPVFADMGTMERMMLRMQASALEGMIGEELQQTRKEG